MIDQDSDGLVDEKDLGKLLQQLGVFIYAIVFRLHMLKLHFTRFQSNSPSHRVLLRLDAFEEPLYQLHHLLDHVFRPFAINGPRR
jgi:hypothetical protein